MSDLIDRQKAIRNICNEDCHQPIPCKWKCIAIEELEALPSAQPTHPTPSNTLGALDCVSREDLTKEIETYFGDLPIAVHYDMLALAQKLPSVHPKIIRCKDCKWRNNQDGATGWLPCRELVTPSDFYCGWADRRGDSDD